MQRRPAECASADLSPERLGGVEFPLADAVQVEAGAEGCTGSDTLFAQLPHTDLQKLPPFAAQ